MTSLFHFEDKVHRRSLNRAESTPPLLSRLLCQVLEHIGFPVEPRLELRRYHEASLTVNQPHPELAEDQPAVDFPTKEQPPLAVHTKEPPVPASSVPTSLPTALGSSTPPVPPTPSITALVDYIYSGLPGHHGCSPRLLCHFGIFYGCPYNTG